MLFRDRLLYGWNFWISSHSLTAGWISFIRFVSFAFALISYMLKSTRFFYFCFAFATKIYCWNEIQPLLYMASYTIFMMRVRLIVDSSQMKPRNFTNGSWHHTKVLNLTLLTTTITETKTTTTTTTEMMLLLTLQCVKHFTEKWWKSILGSMLWGKCKTCLSVPRINSERMAETLHTSHWNASVALLNVFTFLLYILWMNVRNSSRHHFHYLLWLFQQLNLDWRRTTNLKTVSK